MYLYSNKIITNCKNSKWFSINKNQFAYIINNNIIVEEGEKLIADFTFPSFNSIKLLDLNLLIFDEINNLTIYNTITHQPIILNLEKNTKIRNGQNFDENLWIIEKEKSIFENTLGILNLANKTYYLKDNFYPDSIFDNFIFGKSYFKQIARYSVEKGDLLWETDISQIGKYIPYLDTEIKLGEVKKIIGVYNNQVIVLLTGCKFISLNVENGKIIWEQKNINFNKTSQILDSHCIDPYNTFLDKEKGLIYILQGEVFITLNLENQQASYEWHIKDKPTDDYLFIRQSQLFNNQIYFTAFRKGKEGNDDTIGIFDIATKTIIWRHTFDFEKGNFIQNTQDNIQINDNYLYVLDSLETIHIFKKE